MSDNIERRFEIDVHTHISPTQLNLINGILHCCVFRFLSYHHQAIHTNHLKHISSSCQAYIIYRHKNLKHKAQGVVLKCNEICFIVTAVLFEYYNSGMTQNK